MNRFWISYSSGEDGGDNALGIVLLEARDKDHAAELAKQHAPPLGPLAETMIIQFPEPGRDFTADVEWRKLDKDHFYSAAELQKLHYKSSYHLDEETYAKLQETTRTDPRIKIVKQ